jgi:hypothetical protein
VNRDNQVAGAVGNNPDRASNLGSSVEAKPPPLARLSNECPTSSVVYDMLPQPTKDLDVEGPKSRLSAPEIMARTRARLAKLKNEPVAGVLPTSGEADGHDRAGAAKHSSRSFSNDDIRARLLNRLEEDKSQITLPAEQALPRPALSPPDTSWSSKAELDSQAVEAKLRMQAQVRVRLAAAKRATGDHVQDEDVEKDVHKDFGQREESLRATLRERRA